jgi:hypothetical protein
MRTSDECTSGIKTMVKKPMIKLHRHTKKNLYTKRWDNLQHVEGGQYLVEVEEQHKWRIYMSLSKLSFTRFRLSDSL